MGDTELNSYQVLESIHRSRRFSLYLASKFDTGQEVLIKTPDSIRSKDENLIKALMAEADTAKLLTHPAIRRYYDSQGEAGAAFFVGEYIPGRSLARFLNQDSSPIHFDNVISSVCELLDALEHAHNRGIYHQNLNPYNIIVDSEQHLHLIGFGKSKNSWLNGEEGFMPWHPVLFVAPETFQAGQVHPTSDTYSWAVITYLMLCQALPWRVDHMLSYEKQKQQSLCRAVIMPEILKKEVPDWLFTLLLSCLKLDPNQRPDSVTEIRDVIDAAMAPASESLAEEVVTDVPEAVATPIEEVSDVLVPPMLPVAIPEILPDVVDLEPVIPDEQAGESSALSEPTIPEPEPEPEVEQVELTPPEAFTLQILEDAHPAEEAPSPTIEAETEEEPFAAVYQALDEEPEIKHEPVSAEPPQPEELTSLATETQIAKPAATPKELEDLPLLPPKPQRASTSLYQSDPFRRKQEQAGPDETLSLRKTFRLLLWMTLAVLAFIIVKYVVFARRPDFQHPQEEEIVVEEESGTTLGNEPIKMVAVPADTLVMGNTASGAANDEFPLITVKVNKFLMSVTEVTQKEWLMVYPDNPSTEKGNDLPVENVTFYDAVEFCNAKSLKDGYQPCYDFVGNEVSCNFEADGYRLPTEAEWEFAAKAGKRYQFSIYSGSEDPNEVAWHNANSDAHSHPVARKKANPLGLYDLSGNIYEWVWNWYAPYSYRYPEPAQGPVNGTDKVLRGGSWYHDPNSLRVTARFHAKPFSKSNYIGFRVVRSALE